MRLCQAAYLEAAKLGMKTETTKRAYKEMDLEKNLFNYGESDSENDIALNDLVEITDVMDFRGKLRSVARKHASSLGRVRHNLWGRGEGKRNEEH